MLVLRKESQGRYSTRVSLGNEELSIVDEFRYQGPVMTADCREDTDIKKQCRRKNAVAICFSGSSHLDLLRQKFILLPNLWMCSLASFLPELY